MPITTFGGAEACARCVGSIVSRSISMRAAAFWERIDIFFIALGYIQILCSARISSAITRIHAAGCIDCLRIIAVAVKIISISASMWYNGLTLCLSKLLIIKGMKMRGRGLR